MGDEDIHTGDRCCSRGEGGVATAAAPFVMKTYRMVEDPVTDALIAWGSGNNSFVVLDPFRFAQRLLPAYFKHANFSSFVRQLNTYGFRKVDPDRWEFAHESFLRGQTHLLRRVVRRNSGGHRHGGGPHHCHAGKEADGTRGGDEVDDGIAVEVAKLKWKQRAVDEEVRSMWRRLEETERKPRQMLAAFYKAVQNPHAFPRLKQQTAAAAAAATTSSHVCPDDHSSERGHAMLLGMQQDPCLGLQPPEEETLLGSGYLPFGGNDAVAPELPASDLVGLFGGPSQFLPQFVGGGAVRMDEEPALAAATAAAYPFAFSTKKSFWMR